MRGPAAAAGLIVLLATALSASVRAADFEEYRELVDRANRLIEAVREVSVEALPALRETAVEADLAVIEWLDAFIASDEFQQLPDEQREAVLTDRYRWEYNLSIQLIGLGRCEEALTRLQDLLLESPATDQALQDRLLHTLGEAASCAEPAAPEMVTVTIESATPGAQVAVDGVPRGPAPAVVQLEAGEHVAEVSAPGYISQPVHFTARAPETTVPAVALVAMTEPPADDSRTPTWYEWTLWGAGAVGIGTSIVFLVGAADLQDDIDNPPDGFRTPQESVDDADGIRTAGFVIGGVGIVSAAVGLILFLTGDEELSAPSADASQTAFLTPTGFGVRF